ncbi:hypothetical protein DVA86_17130 [Streptomyces armeniacus]|uniref:DUF6895 domain-containing protein n=1 Tax=Streptomyces armeniacus TaxID=83291 RepID=A0A345XR57_9ACTN|nr:hypothetical protein [Streptomyces armeniacus]AXK34123.1 hypothetical protein DVA86_17130 [Streptomyces armeniacus]
MTTSAPTTSPQLLHRVGVGALEWLAANRTYFRARTDADTPGLEIMERFKPLGELAIIGKVLFREGVAGSQQSVLIRDLLDYAWRELLENGELLVWAQRREFLSPVSLELYTPFSELGYRNRQVEENARLARESASWAALEMHPNRRLGMSRVEARAGLPPSVDVAEAARRTWLGRTPEPWTVEYHIAYDITHTVFHLTDWGEHPEALPADIADYLALWLPVWIDDWTDIGHWDLLGELLVVDACLPRPTLDAAAWERYAEAQRPDGAMPVRGPLPTGDPSDVFDVAYHPTLVAAFASVMATSRAMAALAGAPS